MTIPTPPYYLLFIATFFVVFILIFLKYPQLKVILNFSSLLGMY